MPAKFAQLIIGPPGSGKSTYCDGMHQFMSAIGRPCSIVNLDPANDSMSYKPALDVRKLVSIEEIMRDDELGPNGAVLFALETLEKEWEWMEDGLAGLGDDYILFDCPGQVELFTHHNSLRNIFFALQKRLGYRLVVVHLTDSIVLTRPSLYISALLLSLRSMLQLDLPTLNVLSKIDTLASYPSLPFDLEFYTEVQDLTYLLPLLDAEQRGKDISGDRSLTKDDGEEEEEPPPSKFAALSEAIANLVADYALVSFEPLVVEDKRSMATLLHAADKASGYAFGSEGGANDTIWQVAVRGGATSMDVRDVQERWIDRRDEFDALERKEWEEEGKWGASEEGESQDGDDDDMDVDVEEQLEAMRRAAPSFISGVEIRRKKPADAGKEGG